MRFFFLFSLLYRLYILLINGLMIMKELFAGDSFGMDMVRLAQACHRGIPNLVMHFYKLNSRHTLFSAYTHPLVTMNDGYYITTYF
ncbi:hypothetical protein BDA99DRAFT_94992 [Phascolomyces articulosus]|uniref:Uncharacterized protein n=1 Tax=Phascolomyces articulosus TaxID=60185 RepID=A0AAD5JXR7_9FUNG|nr:hypothetical protein BDA99DRAFT_94992 [Phascolomyces articulosus]